MGLDDSNRMAVLGQRKKHPSPMQLSVSFGYPTWKMQQLSSKTIKAEQEKSKIHHIVNAEEKEKPVESGNFPQSRKGCGGRRERKQFN